MNYETDLRSATGDYMVGRTDKGVQYKPEFIVIHHWGELGQSFDNVKKHLSTGGDASKTSIHYIVQGTDANGAVNYRYANLVSEQNTAYDAGDWNANLRSIGIECRPEATDDDYKAVANVIKDIRSRWGDLPIYPHKTFTPTLCPGKWDLVRLENLTKEKEETNMASCTRTTWRGVIVCAHSVPKLNDWAASLGADILLKPLAGCGSYQTSTVASAGTHAGGGAIDIDLRAVPADKRKWVADQGRVAGMQVAWHRNYVAGLWTWHCHALDPHCPNLAPAAAAQVVEFGKGGDGLVGSTPDGNTRANAAQIMGLFATRFVSGVAQAVANDVRVKQMQAAVHQTQDGIWGAQSEIDFRDIRNTAYGKYTGEYFNKYSVASKQRMQKAWGTTQDGKWSVITSTAAQKTAVAIQKALGVTADGVWGTVTDKAYNDLRAKMYKAPAPAAKPAPKPVAKPVDFSLPFVRTGPSNFFPYPGKVGASYYGPSASGKPWYSGKTAGGPNDATWVSGNITLVAIKSRIKKIQKCVGVSQDGLYGAATVAAVKKWQTAHKLPADGIVGPTTWQAMAKSVGN